MGKIILVAAAMGLFSFSSFAKGSGGCLKGTAESALKEAVGLSSTISAPQGKLVVSGSATSITVVSSMGHQLSGKMCARAGRVSANLSGTDAAGKKISGSVVITGSNGSAHLSGRIDGQQLDSAVN